MEGSNLSILIPVYGNHDFAHEAILSAYKYRSEIAEIYIIDDKPDDPLISYYPEFINSCNIIRYEINDSNIGRVKTYNKLLSHCKGDLFIMLDGDDYLSDDINFNFYTAKFSENRKLVLLCGRCSEIFNGQSIKISGPSILDSNSGIEYFRQWIGARNIFPHNACIIRKSVAILCGGYCDDVINADIVLLRKILLEGDVIVSDELLSYWRFHGGNASKTSNVNSLLDNFDSVLIPYSCVKNKGIFINIWLIKNSNYYLLSVFHQICSDCEGGVSARFFAFAYRLIKSALYRLGSLYVLIGFFIALLKVLLLLSLRFLIGHDAYSAVMTKRGNYVYIKH